MEQNKLLASFVKLELLLVQSRIYEGAKKIVLLLSILEHYPHLLRAPSLEKIVLGLSKPIMSKEIVFIIVKLMDLNSKA